jgi:hypothetical protein
MPAVTIAEVLHRAENFERMLSDFYCNLSHSTTHEGARLLTDYMSRHRRRIHYALVKLPITDAADIRRICHAPLRFEPHGVDAHCLEEAHLPADATAGEVLDAAIRFDECLVSFYKQVLQQPIDEHVRTLFASLLRMEEDDEIELKKIKAMDYF